VTTTYAGTILADQPVLYCRLGESVGPTATDQSIENNHGVYENAPTLGVAPNALSDGNPAATLVKASSQNASFPIVSAYSIGDVGSVEGWFKTTTGTGQLGIVSLGFHSLYMRLSAGALQFLVSNVATLGTTAQTYADGAWHHAVCTKNGSTVKMYVDGVDVTPSITNTAATTSAENPTVGSDISGGTPTDFFDGSLDEVAVYPTALSLSQVQAHYAARTTPMTLPYFVQVGDAFQSTGTSQSVTLPVSVKSGNLIALFVKWENTGIENATITDTLGNTYVPIGAAFDPNGADGNGQLQRMYYAANTIPGPCTITATFAGTRAVSHIIAVEVAGCDRQNPFDFSISNGPANSNLSVNGLTAGPAVSPQTNDYVLGILGLTNNSGGGTSISAGTGWALRSSSGTIHISEDRVLTNPPQAVSTQWTLASASSVYIAWVVGFKAAFQFTSGQYQTEMGGRGAIYA
jgi:hypothetical protein